MILKQISSQHSEEILKQMFSRVGAEYSPEFLKQDNWYHKHTWTDKQQDNFRQWLADFLIKHKYATKGKYRGQQHGYYEAGKLIMNYGWKIDNNT